MKKKLVWLWCLLKRLKPYTVVKCYNSNGNYEYSVLCIYKKLSSKCDNFIRIKYNADECEVCGKIDKTMKNDILNKEMAEL